MNTQVFDISSLKSSENSRKQQEMRILDGGHFHFGSQKELRHGAPLLTTKTSPEFGTEGLSSQSSHFSSNNQHKKFYNNTLSRQARTMSEYSAASSKTHKKKWGVKWGKKLFETGKKSKHNSVSSAGSSISKNDLNDEYSLEREELALQTSPYSNREVEAGQKLRLEEDELFNVRPAPPSISVAGPEPVLSDTGDKEEERTHFQSPSEAPSLSDPTVKKKKKVWYKKVFGGKNKAKSEDALSFSRHNSNVSAPEGIFEYVEKNPMPRLKGTDVLPHREDGISLSPNDYRGASASEMGTSTAAGTSTKKKGWKFFQKSSTKKSHSEREDGVSDIDFGLSQIPFEIEDVQRQEALQQRTRKDLLRALNEVQRTYFSRQGMHYLWKYKRLIAILDEKQRKGEDIVSLTQLSEEADSLLQMGQTLNATGKTYDMRRVDWRIIDANAQVRCISVAFAIHQLSRLINKMFDDENYIKAVSNMLQKTESEVREWVVAGLASHGNYTTNKKLTGDLSSSNIKALAGGDLCQGRYILEHLDYLLNEASKTVKDNYYQQMVQLTEEIQLLHNRIATAINETFESLRDVDVELMPMHIKRRLKLTTTIEEEERVYNGISDCTEIIENETVSERLRRFTTYKKQPIGEGFLMCSSREDMEQLEKKLAGKCGSYRLFDKWLHDALKWQWQDLIIQRSLKADEIDFDKLIEAKKTYFMDLVEKRLTQIWMGRSSTLRGIASERAGIYIKSAVERRPAIILTASGVELEQQALAAEDQRARFQKCVLSPVARELFRNTKRYEKSVKGLTNITSEKDIVNTIRMLEDLQNAFKIDGAIINDIEIQTMMEDVKKETVRIWKQVKSVKKQREAKEANYDEKRESLEKKLLAANDILKEERGKLLSVSDTLESAVATKEAELRKMEIEIHSVRTQASEAQARMKRNKLQLKKLNKEIKEANKELSLERRSYHKKSKGETGDMHSYSFEEGYNTRGTKQQEKMDDDKQSLSSVVTDGDKRRQQRRKTMAGEFVHNQHRDYASSDLKEVPKLSKGVRKSRKNWLSAIIPTGGHKNKRNTEIWPGEEDSEDRSVSYNKGRNRNKRETGFISEDGDRLSASSIQREVVVLKNSSKGRNIESKERKISATTQPGMFEDLSDERNSIGNSSNISNIDDYDKRITSEMYNKHQEEKRQVDDMTRWKEPNLLDHYEVKKSKLFTLQERLDGNTNQDSGSLLELSVKSNPENSLLSDEKEIMQYKSKNKMYSQDSATRMDDGYDRLTTKKKGWGWFSKPTKSIRRKHRVLSSRNHNEGVSDDTETVIKEKPLLSNFSSTMALKDKGESLEKLRSLIFVDHGDDMSIVKPSLVNTEKRSEYTNESGSNSFERDEEINRAVEVDRPTRQISISGRLLSQTAEEFEQPTKTAAVAEGGQSQSLEVCETLNADQQKPQDFRLKDKDEKLIKKITGDVFLDNHVTGNAVSHLSPLTNFTDERREISFNPGESSAKKEKTILTDFEKIDEPKMIDIDGSSFSSISYVEKDDKSRCDSAASKKSKNWANVTKLATNIKHWKVGRSNKPRAKTSAAHNHQRFITNRDNTSLAFQEIHENTPMILLQKEPEHNMPFCLSDTLTNREADLSSSARSQTRELFLEDFDEMTIPLLSDILKRAELTCLLSENERTAIERNATILSFNKNEPIIVQDDPVTSMLIIKDGCVRAARNSSSSHEITIFGKADILFYESIVNFFNEDENQYESDNDSKEGYGGRNIVPKAPFSLNVESNSATIWSLPLALMVQICHDTRRRIQIEFGIFLRHSLELFNTLSSNEALRLATLAKAVIITKAPTILSLTSDVFYIVWEGNVVINDWANERIEQYHKHDAIGIETFGRCNMQAANVDIYARSSPSILLMITVKNVEASVQSSDISSLLKRHHKRNASYDALMASMESLSVAKHKFSNKSKRSLGNVITQTSKFIGKNASKYVMQK